MINESLVKSKKLLAALIRTGWESKRTSASHKILSKHGYSDYIFAFHDNEEIEPKMLSRIAKHTGLKPCDL